MQPHKFVFSLSAAIALLVVLSGVALVRNQRKAALEAQARKEIQKIYDSPIYNSVDPAPANDPNWQERNSRTIQGLVLQGDGATALVKWHYFTSFTDPKTKKPSQFEVVQIERNTWKKVAGKWVSGSTRILSSDGVQNGKPFHKSYGVNGLDQKVTLTITN